MDISKEQLEELKQRLKSEKDGLGLSSEEAQLLDSLLRYPPGTQLTVQSLRKAALASLADKLRDFFEKDYRSATYRFEISISVQDFDNCRVAIIDRGQHPGFIALQEFSKRYNISDVSSGLRSGAHQSLGSIPQVEGSTKKMKNDKAGPAASVSSPNEVTSPAQIFLCHSSHDKERIRELNTDLTKEGFSTWVDEENLLPGQNWEFEIKRAVRICKIVLVCLSRTSTTQDGYVHREIKIALDAADRKPEGTIFVIPARIEECELPDRLAHLHCVDLFKPTGFSMLLKSLRHLASN